MHQRKHVEQNRCDHERGDVNKISRGTFGERTIKRTTSTTNLDGPSCFFRIKVRVTVKPASKVRPNIYSQLKVHQPAKTMAQETNQSPVPVLCTTGCGFYGNPRTNGMCSVCHKEHLSRQNNGGINSMAPIGSSGSAVEVSAIQRLEASLNNAAAAAVAAAEEAAESASSAEAAAIESFSGVSVTHQMTELSLSCEEKDASGGKVELTDPVVCQPTTSASGTEESPEPIKPKKNRCFMCRKKVGLTGFDCRCGNIFCGIHRYSDKHNCPYDYKAEAAAKIRKENPVVMAEKIQRI